MKAWLHHVRERLWWTFALAWFGLRLGWQMETTVIAVGFGLVNKRPEDPNERVGFQVKYRGERPSDVVMTFHKAILAENLLANVISDEPVIGTRWVREMVDSAIQTSAMLHHQKVDLR